MEPGVVEAARRRSPAGIETTVPNRPPDPVASVGASAPLARKVGSCTAHSLHRRHYPDKPGHSASSMRH